MLVIPKKKKGQTAFIKLQIGTLISNSYTSNFS